MTLRRSRLALALLFVLLYGAALVPFFLCDPLPLNDYPNHLARMHVIAELDRSAELQRHYAVHWQLLPNLAMDLLVPPLARVVSAETATWLFTAAILLLLASGTIALHWTLFGRLTLYPFAAFLLLYNRDLLWGFLNFCFGAGLGLWVFVAWLRLRHWSSWLRSLLFAALVLALYFAHIHAFCCLGLLVMGYELSAAWPAIRDRQARALIGLASAAIPLLVPVLLFLLRSGTSELAGDISFGSPLFKLSRLLSPFNNYSLPLDAATLLSCGALLLGGLLWRRVTLHPRMKLPLLLLLLLFIALPQQLFDAWSVDRRVLMVFSFVVVASTSITALPRRWSAVIATGLVLLFLVCTGVVALNWQRAQTICAEQIALLDKVERGSRLAVVVVGPDRPHLQNPPLWELANIAVVRRHVHVNSMFAQRGHHILRVRFAPGGRFYRSPSQKFVVDQSVDPAARLQVDLYRQLPLREFDYLYLINEQLIDHPRPEWLEPVASAGPGTLYRVIHGATSSIPAATAHARVIGDQQGGVTTNVAKTLHAVRYSFPLLTAAAAAVTLAFACGLTADSRWAGVGDPGVGAGSLLGLRGGAAEDGFEFEGVEGELLGEGGVEAQLRGLEVDHFDELVE